jgi:hypothetical protein
VDWIDIAQDRDKWRSGNCQVAAQLEASRVVFSSM